MKDKVKGQIVLVGKPALVPVNLNPPAKRRPDDRRARAVRSEQPGRRPRRPRRGDAGDQPPATDDGTNEINRRVDEFLVANGARVRVNDAGREHGQIIAFNNRTFDVDQGGADRRDAQRGLRPHRAHPRRRDAGRARVQHREQGVPGRPDRRTTRSPRSPAPTRKTKS